MNRTRRQPLGGTDAATLLADAAAGEEPAFDGLFRRYGPEAWKLASGVSGNDASARYAVTDGFATSVVAAREGAIVHPGGFRRSLLHATRLRVAERDDPAAPGHGDSTEPVAPSFAALPELMRSVLWLEHVHGLRQNRIAEVTDVDATEVADLARRARHGLATQYLDAQARATDGDHAHALRSSARSLVRRLPVRERAAVRDHLGGCDSCAAVVALVRGLDDALPPLAAAFPEDLIDDARGAWLVAIAPPAQTGLSPLVEKVLAATSAAAAVVAIVGAAYWRGTPAGGDSVAISPVLHQLGAPLPDLGVDLDSPVEVDSDADATADGDTPTGTGGTTGTRTASGSPTPAPAPTQGLSSGSGATASPGMGNTIGSEVGGSDTGGSTGGSTDGGGGGGGGGGGETTPPSPPPAEPDDSLLVITTDPVSLDVSSTPGATVGGTTIGSQPASGGDTIETGGVLDVLDPVTDAVNDTVGLLGG